MANNGPKLTTGLPYLDRVLHGIISGDNVVWHVDSIEDYLPFVEPYCEAARQSGIRLIYFRFAKHRPLVTDSPGVEIHPRILAAAPEAPVVTKAHADGFVETTLEEELEKLGVTELLVCGMMTQNCVTHTAISPTAEFYDVTILPDCCTTVDEMLHNIALHAVSTRVKLAPSTEVL